MHAMLAGALFVLASGLGLAPAANHGADYSANDALVHETASLTIEMMPTEQQKALWRRAKVYAEYEAVLELCGRAFGFERKAVNAIKSCVRKDSLDRLRAYFRRNKAVYRAEWGAHKKKVGDGFCRTKKIADAMRKIRKIFARDVKNASDQCQSCWIC